MEKNEPAACNDPNCTYHGDCRARRAREGKATIQGYDPSNARCDPEVYMKGSPICMFHATSVLTEEWVRKVAAESGERVDWHYVGGYAIVKFIGDREKVEAAVVKLARDLPNGHERFQMADLG